MSTVSFADVAHQTLIFDSAIPAEKLVLKLLDSRWMQRLRLVGQTGNTKLVYMFAEHSRFGHSLGVAYLAGLLMRHLRTHSPALVEEYELAVQAAALLHDIGHVAPGSHLGERIWCPEGRGRHEMVGSRVIREDQELKQILNSASAGLSEKVCKILEDDDSLPPWTREVISGSGWNADRGNWSIVDSTMCAVSYGRYNVLALIDAFRLTSNGELVLQESRLDALTHFFVARDSMYRQIYQHRALQAVDSLTENVARRARDVAREGGANSGEAARKNLDSKEIFCDDTMLSVLLSNDYSTDLAVPTLFHMTEPWWSYHIARWCDSKDGVLSDLSIRLRDRRLLKTIRVNSDAELSEVSARATEAVKNFGLDPRYYLSVIQEADTHRGKDGDVPQIQLDSGAVVPVTKVEPLIAQLLAKPVSNRRWVAVPQEVKAKLGYVR